MRLTLSDPGMYPTTIHVEDEPAALERLPDYDHEYTCAILNDDSNKTVQVWSREVGERTWKSHR